MKLEPVDSKKITHNMKDWSEETDIAINNWLSVDDDGNEYISPMDVLYLREDLRERFKEESNMDKLEKILRSKRFLESKE